MSATEILEQIRRLPEAESRELVERIEDEFMAPKGELTPEQIIELERRATEALAHPETCRPMEDVFAEIEKKYRSKP